MLIPIGLITSAKNSPNQCAIVDGEARLTYKEWEERVSRLKQALLDQGIGHGDRVALLMFNQFRFLEVFYAATAIGAIVVPLNVRLSPGEIIDCLKDAEPKIIFLHREFLPWIPKMAMHVFSLQTFVLAESGAERAEGVKDYEEWIASRSHAPLLVEGVKPDDVACIYYTGGTTGRPKGVMLTHANLTSNAYHAAIAFRYSRNTRYMHAAPMFHVADGASTLAVTLVGGTHHHLRTFRPKDFLERVAKEESNATMLVPTMIQMVVQDPISDVAEIPSLTQILYGASHMPLDVLKKAKEKWPHIQFYQSYGMSEASPLVTLLPPEDHRWDGDREMRRLASCGKGIVGVEVKVVREDGTETAVGEVGEVIVRGPNIMKGYWKQPEETAKVLKKGWYHTGDLAIRDEENYLYIVDRKKDMIITGGENVYSIEVERVLYQHPAVKEAAVIGIPDAKWGEAVKAIVVLHEGKEVGEAELRDFCRERLAGYKVPKSVDFLPELPKSGAGKILKRILREAYGQSKDGRLKG